jgi:hypothetical protein
MPPKQKSRWSCISILTCRCMQSNSTDIFPTHKIFFSMLLDSQFFLANSNLPLERSTERDLLQSGIYDESLNHGTGKKRTRRRDRDEATGSVRNRIQADGQSSEYDAMTNASYIDGYSYVGDASPRSGGTPMFDEEVFAPLLSKPIGDLPPLPEDRLQLPASPNERVPYFIRIRYFPPRQSSNFLRRLFIAI